MIEFHRAKILIPASTLVEVSGARARAPRYTYLPLGHLDVQKPNVIFLFIVQDENTIWDAARDFGSDGTRFPEL